jgi:predicted nucleic acid-binding protein
MSGPVFVDANVLIYAYDATEPVKSLRAREWLTRLWHERTGRTSMQVLNEFYVNVTRKVKPGLPRDAAWEDVTTYFAWRPTAIDEMLLRRAREVERRYQLSWWDSMVVAAAQLQDCVVLLTEDLQDGMVFGTLAVRSPFSSVLEEPPAEYTVARANPLHRPRGRPRRSTVSA